MTCVAYDLTRLILNYTKPTPNGIDRVDITLAKHFAGKTDWNVLGACLTGARPAVVDRSAMARLVGKLDQAWSGSDVRTGDPEPIEQRLLAGGSDKPRSPQSQARPPRRTQRSDLAYLLAPPRAYRSWRQRLPHGAVFLHAFHSPFPATMRWLSDRPDLKPVFFVHDLLALDFPEYFTPSHVEHELRWHGILADHARGAIVNSHDVAQKLAAYLQRAAGKTIPILVAPMPADPVFAAEDLADEDLRRSGYFVMCGTIEPRKNHLMVLQVWRELARRLGPSAPRLLVLGRRGWGNDAVLDLLERTPSLRGLVIEAAGLPSRAVAKLVANARAVLMPSFGEGYGLPIVEALAAGTAVIASDIPVFREFEHDGAMTFLHPLDGSGWLAAVVQHAAGPVRGRPRQRSAKDYFAAIDAFLTGL